MDRIASSDGRAPRPALRRFGRAALLGFGFSLGLAVGGSALALIQGKGLLPAVMWAEFGGGTAVCGVAALLLLWRPGQPGQTEERERTASLGFYLMLSGALPFLLGLLLSAAGRV